MTSDDQILSRYFSSSYKEGREKFLSACQAAGLSVESHAHPSLKGPSGEDLCMDTVRIGPANAARVLIFSCGTHGLEAAAGSATMLRWLDMNGPVQLPGDIAVLLIHAVNPYGWAWSRRGNEDGIDLNRNFLTFVPPLPANPAYGDIHPLLLEAGVDDEALAEFARAFHAVAADKGINHALTGITSGQYDYTDGLSFGGHARSWSCQTLYRIARRHLGRAAKILHVDWHTGIGAYGQAHFILDEPKGSKTHALLSRWWPDHDIHCDDVVDGVSITYNGLFVVGFRDEIAMFSDADVVNLTIEWGTFEVATMLQALVMDNWLVHRAGSADAALAGNVRAQLVERFYPSAADWRRNVLSASEKIYAQAIAGLAGWVRT
ncbi:MAG TPA: DUF2817 domain-containing protein [Hyphomonas sp.]|nr:DUF2817 domain-containing protein [Hyphomonas sp.]HRX73171.1 DUF2817 domain-containing protein [Hyphomonas sp.]